LALPITFGHKLQGEELPLFWKEVDLMKPHTTSMALLLMLAWVGTSGEAQDLPDGPQTTRTDKVVRGAGEQQKWALLVAVNNYGDRRIPRLSYCGEDIKSLRDTLIQDGGFPENHVFMLHDKQADVNRWPMRIVIQQMLSQILVEAGPNDQIVVAFSMHGVLLGGTSYLCPIDADLSKPAQTLLPVAWLYETLSAGRGAQKVLILDACRSPAAVSRDIEVEPLRSAFAQSLERVPRGVVSLASCAAGERSYEHSALQHGVFFHFLLKGLKGEADARGNRRVDVEELFQYTKAETPKYVRANFSGSQTPEMYCTNPSAARSIILAKPGSPRPAQGQIPSSIVPILNGPTEDEGRVLMAASLARIAARVAAAGEMTPARVVFRRALKMAGQIQDAGHKDGSLEPITDAQVEAKDFAEATRTCEKIKDARTKAETACVIAKARADGGDFGGAWDSLAMVADISSHSHLTNGELSFGGDRLDDLPVLNIVPRKEYERSRSSIYETARYVRAKELSAAHRKNRLERSAPASKN
jgi:hypothetical protein